ERQECTVGWVSLDPPYALVFHQAAVVAQQCGPRKRLECGVAAYVDDSSVEGDVARWGVADATDLELVSSAEHTLDGHLVAGQRARLVGADDRDRSQCLHRWEASYDRPSLGHPLDAERKRHRH